MPYMIASDILSFKFEFLEKTEVRSSLPVGDSLEVCSPLSIAVGGLVFEVRTEDHDGEMIFIQTQAWVQIFKNYPIAGRHDHMPVKDLVQKISILSESD